MADVADLLRPALALPPEEAEVLRDAYAGAEVILEYGAGGSTVMAAELPGQAVFSVESDRAWADDLVRWFAVHPPTRRVMLHHEDIGPTGKWGTPTDPAAWPRYHRYPLSVWDREEFLHPDLVLIDGRFRVACFLATLFRIERPVTLLWDDYADREAYRAAERYARPVGMHGRLARFDLSPMALPPADLAWVMNQFTKTK